MVTLLLDSAHLEIALSRTERTVAFRRGNVAIDRSTISRVLLTADPWTWLRGIRSPGTEIPGVLAVGAYRTPSGKDFVLVRRRRPGVVIELDGHDEFARIVLTTRHGADLVTALHLDAGERPRDVVDLATGAIDQVVPVDPDTREAGSSLGDGGGRR